MKNKYYFFLCCLFLTPVVSESSDRGALIVETDNTQGKLSSFFEEKASLNIENIFSLNKKELLPESHAWSISLPKSKWTLSYPFNKDFLFKIGFDFSYEKNSWSYSLDNLFIDHVLELPFVSHFKAGYFSYPVSYRSKNSSNFSKKTLVQKSLFPFVKRAIGFLFESKLRESFYWNVSLQAYTDKRKRDVLQRMDIRPSVTGSLLYKNKKQKAFLSYFQKELPLNSEMKSLGAGAIMFYDMSFLEFHFRGEFWGVRKSRPHQDTFTFYIFPSIKWKNLDLGVLLGGAYQGLQKDQSHRLEYIFKGDFYLTEDILFRIERSREQEWIVKEKSWTFSLRTDFDIKSKGY